MNLIAHRGNGNHKYRENTKEAILNILKEEYIDGVEFDIRLTKDKKFVLSHSPIYKDSLIKNKKMKDLQLNNLNEVLKSINTNKIILIDIKSELDNEKILVKKLYKIIKKYKYLNIYLSSFNYSLVKKIKEKFKNKVGIIISNVININKNIDNFDFIMKKYNVKKVYDKETMIWTVNKKEIIKKYLNQNIFIITDKPYYINEIEKYDII